MKQLRELDYSVLQQCMHCGLCLPTCPTYDETRLERHSPRGRIALMRAIADGELTVTKSFAAEMDYCLGCLACTTACPAGVNYTELFETARAESEASGVQSTPRRRFLRWSLMRVLFTRPRLFRITGRLLYFWQRSGLENAFRSLGLTRLLPAWLRRAEAQSPRIQKLVTDERVPAVSPPTGPARHRVAVLTGCVQDLVFSDVNEATVEVLVANGCEVHVPRMQSCCGSLHAHNGDPETAKLLARRMIDSFDASHFDAIISNAGGCGSHLRHYGSLLADDPAYTDRAKQWSAKVRDIHEFLVEIDFRKPEAPAQDTPKTVLTYHDSCHLCHGQRVTAQPRAILRALPGFSFVECAESTWCCGSAGTYSLTQPDTATRLQQRKIGHLCATGAEVVALANPGCHLQIENGFTPGQSPQPRIVHPVVLLAEAYRAEARARLV